jgi:ketosteroid isomerase-like protein
MSKELIERLYGAMNDHDGDAMAACYADDAVFEDPAFGELRDGAVKDMWRMLCAGASDLKVDLHEHEAGADSGTGHWVATYTFRTGRKVVNDIQATYKFRDGLIADHRDVFDLRKWAGQAIGPSGVVLGLTPLLTPFIRRTTGRQLAAFQAKS